MRLQGAPQNGARTSWRIAYLSVDRPWPTQEGPIAAGRAPLQGLCPVCWCWGGTAGEPPHRATSCLLVLGRALSGSAPGPGTRQVSLRPQPLAGCRVGACGEDECPPTPSLGWVGARAEGCPTSPWVQDVFRLSGRGSPWARPACHLPAD